MSGFHSFQQLCTVSTTVSVGFHRFPSPRRDWQRNLLPDGRSIDPPRELPPIPREKRGGFIVDSCARGRPNEMSTTPTIKNVMVSGSPTNPHKSNPSPHPNLPAPPEFAMLKRQTN